MPMEHIQANQERLANYRTAIEHAIAALHGAEAELEKERADLTAFERVVDGRLKPLMDQLKKLEEEVQAYTIEINRRQSRGIYDDGYPTIEEQLRMRNDGTTDPAPLTQPLSLQVMDKKEFKRIYRQLARRYHPDLATDEDEKARRNEKMTAINDAYAAGSVVEMITLNKEFSGRAARIAEHETTQGILQQALETELYQIRRRIQEIEEERKNLHNHPMVQLSLQFKLAQREGRDLLAELAAELKHEIEMNRAELNRLKAQLGLIEPQILSSSPKKALSSLARRLLKDSPDPPLCPRLRGSY